MSVWFLKLMTWLPNAELKILDGKAIPTVLVYDKKYALWAQ